MNPLQEHPNLFANGKFEAKHIEEGYECTGVIESYAVHGPSFTIYDGEFDQGVSVQSCTLIARPIEDMTNEEMASMFNYPNDDSYSSASDWSCEREAIAKEPWDIDRDKFLYLLSIGVYPFDQSHFGETVIDSRML